MVTLYERQLLWTKIRDFNLDEENAVIKFSDKLAEKQRWSPDFTKRVIEEYRRFIFLCCISGKGASPSQAVDEGWHLHLTYTRSYWMDFCRNTLGKDIHHHPSSGGDTEDHRHEEWYRDTLLLYAEVFGKEAPADIWPRPTDYAPRTIVPEPVTNMSVAWIVFFSGMLLLYFYLDSNLIFMFRLRGPDFLHVIFLLCVLCLVCFVIDHTRGMRAVQEIAEDYFPTDANPFQMAHFLYGKHRAMQSAIIGLLQKKLLEVDAHKRFFIHPDRYIPPEREINPLVPDALREREGASFSYRQLMERWYDSRKFSHDTLDALTEFINRRRPLWRVCVFPFIVYAIGLVRLIQGIWNGKPV
ncbi:MAG: hypothetical protein JST39_05070, partial [Bacteroidetes bacterium]|nr:hypothetical protein [Bacteroidota bacterium]